MKPIYVDETLKIMEMTKLFNLALDNFNPIHFPSRRV